MHALSAQGRYTVRKLIEKYGHNGHMMEWKEQLNGDCPHPMGSRLMKRCPRY